ncbi:hypothetical protein O1611_g4469 [Lasiodiplodia mahajangana]|uniref:Uncharacterized protein n=1 Tax=Lasiodiplodia mahajangana TaxID=1108764 RepID=A0ACC2JPH1_9PEZI|nr:hypothetical protein O1611_g4469 [Lasiodiplodia mahajangana]
MSLPKLPARAAYLRLNAPLNAPGNNLITLEALNSLRQQLIDYNTPPDENKPLLLPEFGSNVFRQAFKYARKRSTPMRKQYAWVQDTSEWQKRRSSLPKVLVLRSEGPVFSRGYNLKEQEHMSSKELLQIYRRCADVVSLIRQSPIPVVGVIHGLASGPGAQLALTTDLPVAIASAQFQLPGMSVGLPCTLSSVALSRRLGSAFTYRMLALGEPVRADELPPGTVETVADEAALEKRVSEIVEKLAEHSSGQAQAMGKWAYWTQAAMRDPNSDATASRWAAEVTAIHAGTGDAIEGIQAFNDKRVPAWHT